MLAKTRDRFTRRRRDTAAGKLAALALELLGRSVPGLGLHELGLRLDQIPSVCGLTSAVRVNITDLLSELGFLLRNLGLDNHFEFESISKSDFIEGRSARINIDGKVRGYFGEVAPEILTNFGIGYPVVAFELHLPRDMNW